MNPLIIHSVEPGQTEIKVEVCNTVQEVKLLLDLGLDGLELGAKGKTEFLSPNGVQYIVEFLIHGAWTHSKGGSA